MSEVTWSFLHHLAQSEKEFHLFELERWNMNEDCSSSVHLKIFVSRMGIESIISVFESGSVDKLPSQSESSFRRKPESRAPGENRDPVFEMVPDFRLDDVWMPPYQVRGRLRKPGMTEKAVYGQTLIL